MKISGHRKKLLQTPNILEKLIEKYNLSEPIILNISIRIDSK